MDIHMWISLSVQHLDIYIGIWDIYMPSIIPQPLATDPSHGRAKIAAIYVNLFVIDDDNLSSSPAGGANMGPGAPPAPAQERRTPTIGAALLPTGSGLAPTRVLSYNAVTVGQAQTRPCRGATTEGVPARKSMSGAYWREYKKAFSSFRSTGRGDEATGVHRAFSDGYKGASIEYSLMYTMESPSSIV